VAANPNILAGCNKTKQVPSFKQQCGVRGISVKIGTLRAAAICGALGIFVSATTLGPAKAATLLGSGTYQTTNDLTRIDVGGIVLDFLDLPLTTGQTPTQALATYGSAGFTLATDVQVSALFSAFGIAYGFAPGDVFSLSVDGPTAANFISYLGATQFGTLTMGQFDALGFGNSYFCIGCPASFVYNVGSTLIAANIGSTLVRIEDVGSTPLPAALPLFAGGLGVIGLLARRRKRKNAV
jgi:hypothetical protein